LNQLIFYVTDAKKDKARSDKAAKFAAKQAKLKVQQPVKVDKPQPKKAAAVTLPVFVDPRSR